MSQNRLYLQADEATARIAYATLDMALEETGWPLAIFQAADGSNRYEVSLYTPADVTPAQMLDALGPDFTGLKIECEILPDIDWVARSLEGLAPVRAGRFVVHGAHDRGAQRAGEIGIEIEAGQAFGTGHHGTTAGCLMTIGNIVRRKKPQRTLDLGTGSAVLAIAVARLARTPVLATDIDPVAVEVAARNVRANGVAALVRCVSATGFHHRAIAAMKPFDLIVANILAGPLTRLAPAMARHLAPGGSAVLSGILARQRRAVIAAYRAQGFRHIRTRRLGEWVTLHLQR